LSFNFTLFKFWNGIVFSLHNCFQLLIKLPPQIPFLYHWFHFFFNWFILEIDAALSNLLSLASSFFYNWLFRESSWQHFYLV
jgi:hypothetical protein